MTIVTSDLHYESDTATAIAIAAMHCRAVTSSFSMLASRLSSRCPRYFPV